MLYPQIHKIIYNPHNSIMLTSPTRNNLIKRRRRSNLSPIITSSPFIDSPIITSSAFIDSPLIVSPVISVPRVPRFYRDENDVDFRLKKKVTKYFYRKLIDWLDDDFKKLTKKNKKDDILEHIFTIYDMKSFLKRFVRKTGIVWYDLRDNRSYVKKVMYKKLKRKLFKSINRDYY